MHLPLHVLTSSVVVQMARCDLCIGHCPAGVVGIHGVRDESGETFELCISEHLASREGGPSVETSVG